MFEVGKKYQNIKFGTIRECLAVRNGTAFLSEDFGGDPYSQKPYVTEDINAFVEYHEPKIEKILKKYHVGDTYNQGLGVYPGNVLSDYDGLVEFTLTDGVVTDVRLVTGG